MPVEVADLAARIVTVWKRQVKEERAFVRIAAEKMAIAVVPVEQAGQHCSRVSLHVLAELSCLLKPL